MTFDAATRDGLYRAAGTLVVWALIGPALRDTGLFNERETLGIFFGLIIGAAVALAQLQIAHKANIRWAIGGALGTMAIISFFRQMGLPFPFATPDHLFGALCGYSVGAVAVSCGWPKDWGSKSAPNNNVRAD